MPSKPNTCPGCGGLKMAESGLCLSCHQSSVGTDIRASRPLLNPGGLCECGCGKTTPRSLSTDIGKGYVRGEHMRFLRNHHHKRPYTIDEETGCWIWQGWLNPKGYAGNSAHRRYYKRFKGTIPAKMELDHLCRNRACVNPEHLEPVTHAENCRRGDYSKPPIGRWSKLHDACITCATTTRRHHAHGLCTRCWFRQYEKQR